MRVALKHIAFIQTGVFAKPVKEGQIVYLQSKHFDENGILRSSLYPDLKAGAALYAPLGGCTSLEYGDLFDPMGTGYLNFNGQKLLHFNAVNKEALGWMNVPAVTPSTVIR